MCHDSNITDIFNAPLPLHNTPNHNTESEHAQEASV
jgi:hypothetical protein